MEGKGYVGTAQQRLLGKAMRAGADAVCRFKKIFNGPRERCSQGDFIRLAAGHLTLEALSLLAELVRLCRRFNNFHGVAYHVICVLNASGAAKNNSLTVPTK